jgi:hypothetical protein
LGGRFTPNEPITTNEQPQRTTNNAKRQTDSDVEVSMSARNGDKARHALQKRKVRTNRARLKEYLKSKTQQVSAPKGGK